jgi:hypothetical protein
MTIRQLYPQDVQRRRSNTDSNCRIWPLLGICIGCDVLENDEDVGSEEGSTAVLHRWRAARRFISTALKLSR